eukprot:6195762-Pleurochrysis_carterae.AAC.3
MHAVSEIFLLHESCPEICKTAHKYAGSSCLHTVCGISCLPEMCGNGKVRCCRSMYGLQYSIHTGAAPHTTNTHGLQGAPPARQSRLIQSSVVFDSLHTLNYCVDAIMVFTKVASHSTNVCLVHAITQILAVFCKRENTLNAMALARFLQSAIDKKWLPFGIAPELPNTAAREMNSTG